jgi:hypothetical protein
MNYRIHDDAELEAIMDVPDFVDFNKHPSDTNVLWIATAHLLGDGSVQHMSSSLELSQLIGV